MNYFTDLYFKTIDPTFSYFDLFNIAVLYSILLHTIVYFIGFTVVKNIFKINISNISIILFLLFIMFFGYFGRLMRSKSIYATLINKGYDEKDATHETIKVMHSGYFRFYFIG